MKTIRIMPHLLVYVNNEEYELLQRTTRWISTKLFDEHEMMVLDDLYRRDLIKCMLKSGEQCVRSRVEVD